MMISPKFNSIRFAQSTRDSMAQKDDDKLEDKLLEHPKMQNRKTGVCFSVFSAKSCQPMPTEIMTKTLKLFLFAAFDSG